CQMTATSWRKSCPVCSGEGLVFVLSPLVGSGSEEAVSSRAVPEQPPPQRHSSNACLLRRPPGQEKEPRRGFCQSPVYWSQSTSKSPQRSRS
ncbi:unnamed protein product, partial [Sphagnum tenellum]